MRDDARWTVEFTARARKDFRQLDHATRVRILDALESLAGAPLSVSGVKPLQGRAGWRVRVGNYRIIYELEGKRLVVLVLRMAHRREAYR